MRRLQRIVDAVDRAAVLIAEIALFALMALIFVSILGRAFLGFTVPDRAIWTEILMVVVVFLALGHVQKIGGHLAVTVLADRLPRGVNAVLRAVGLVLGIAIYGGAAWFSARVALGAYESDAIFFSSVTDIKRWPALALVPLGLGWWAIRMALQLLHPWDIPTPPADALPEPDTADGRGAG